MATMTRRKASPPAASKPTARELLADTELELADAEAAIGELILDGGDIKAAQERISQAKTMAEAVLEEDKRAEEAREAQFQRDEAMARWRVVSWYAAYVARIKPVLKLRAELEVAEQRAMELDNVQSASGRAGVWNQWFGEELESGRLPNISLPNNAVGGQWSYPQQHAPPRAVTDGMTLETCDEWGKRLAPLVEEQAKPLGKDAKVEELPWVKGARDV